MTRLGKLLASAAMLPLALSGADLTRAEILARFKSPIVTRADGLVRVYANCPEDMRREFQTPIARFADDTATLLYRALALRPIRFREPGIVIVVGDVRTNLTDIGVSVTTNGARTVTRLRVRAPAFADLERLRGEIVKGFYRSVKGCELTDAEARAAYRRADPALRVADERQKLEDWLAGTGTTNDEEGLRLMRRVFEPGRASRRDVLIFASRLFLYPPQFDARFAGRYASLSFREAVKLARRDPLARFVAYLKANELPTLGGGRGDELTAAAYAYRTFLLEFAAANKNEGELLDLLDAADTRLNLAFERAK